ncbi:hypothetical protein B4U80_14774, partial [Leptotrombidium deliense]
MTGEQYYWLSAYRVHFGSDVYKWTENIPFKYQAWYENEPNVERTKNSNCTSFYKGQWFTDYCNYKHYQLCQKTIYSIIYERLNEKFASFEKQLKNNFKAQINEFKTIRNTSDENSEKIENFENKLIRIAERLETIFSTKPDTDSLRKIEVNKISQFNALYDDISYQSCYQTNQSGAIVSK